MVFVLLAALPAASERDEANRIAEKYKAKVEVTLDDGSRCDLLAKDCAWEVDWASKWAEGIGQSLHYGISTRRQPGLILLTDDPGRDWRLLVRAAEVCGRCSVEFRVEITKKEIEK